MRKLFYEIGRAIRLTPLELRVRWHAWRTTRHRDLQHRHSLALGACIGDVRTLVSGPES